MQVDVELSVGETLRQPVGQMDDQRRAILLARLSDKREDVDLTDEDIPASLDDQIQRMRDRAARLGWDVYKVIKNPRLSAYKKRKVTLPDGRRE